MPLIHRCPYYYHWESPSLLAARAQQPIRDQSLRCHGLDGLLPMLRLPLLFDFRPWSHIQTTSDTESTLQDGYPGQLETISFFAATPDVGIITVT